MKLRSGTPPKDANGYIAESSEYGWTIYRRAASVAPWVSLKVVHLEPHEGAANYWLGWHTIDHRFGYGKDTQRMQECHPEAFKWVTDAMTELFPTLTEEDMAL